MYNEAALGELGKELCLFGHPFISSSNPYQSM